MNNKEPWTYDPDSDTWASPKYHTFTRYKVADGTYIIMEKSRWYEPHPIHKNILDKIYREVDGLYYFDTGEGMIAAHTMREIADKLDYINKDWPKNSFKSK